MDNHNSSGSDGLGKDAAFSLDDITKHIPTVTGETGKYYGTAAGAVLAPLLASLARKKRLNAFQMLMLALVGGGSGYWLGGKGGEWLANRRAAGVKPIRPEGALATREMEAEQAAAPAAAPSAAPSDTLNIRTGTKPMPEAGMPADATAPYMNPNVGASLGFVPEEPTPFPGGAVGIGYGAKPMTDGMRLPSDKQPLALDSSVGAGLSSEQELPSAFSVGDLNIQSGRRPL